MQRSLSTDSGKGSMFDESGVVENNPNADSQEDFTFMDGKLAMELIEKEINPESDEVKLGQYEKEAESVNNKIHENFNDSDNAQQDEKDKTLYDNKGFQRDTIETTAL